MFCAKCGNRMEKEQKFCAGCGAGVAGNNRVAGTVPTSVAQKEFGKHRQLIVGGAVLAVIVLLVVNFTGNGDGTISTGGGSTDLQPQQECDLAWQEWERERQEAIRQAEQERQEARQQAQYDAIEQLRTQLLCPTRAVGIWIDSDGHYRDAEGRYLVMLPGRYYYFGFRHQIRPFLP